MSDAFDVLPGLQTIEARLPSLNHQTPPAPDGKGPLALDFQSQATVVPAGATLDGVDDVTYTAITHKVSYDGKQYVVVVGDQVDDK